MPDRPPNLCSRLVRTRRTRLFSSCSFSLRSCTAVVKSIRSSEAFSSSSAGLSPQRRLMVPALEFCLHPTNARQKPPKSTCPFALAAFFISTRSASRSAFAMGSLRFASIRATSSSGLAEVAPCSTSLRKVLLTPPKACKTFSLMLRRSARVRLKACSTGRTVPSGSCSNADCLNSARKPSQSTGFLVDCDVELLTPVKSARKSWSESTTPASSRSTWRSS
mmetsp:Transcript_7429/g.20984  ORF Transcript_7429/g.20984 Transcript_7429/m.20984 type:complete len:221 (-) Transcript_7429:1128-1790(-)